MKVLGGKVLEFIQICQIAPHESYTSATPSNGEGRAWNASDRAFIRNASSFSLATSIGYFSGHYHTQPISSFD